MLKISARKTCPSPLSREASTPKRPSHRLLRGPGAGEEGETAEGGGERGDDEGGGRGGGRGVIAVLDDGHEMDQCSCDLVKVYLSRELGSDFAVKICILHAFPLAALPQ